MQQIIEAQTLGRIVKMQPRELSQPSTDELTKARIKALVEALTRVGIARKELLGEVGLEVYSVSLASEFPDDGDTYAVLNRMMVTPRAEYEAAMPSLPDLLGMVRRAAQERVWAAKRAQREQEEAEAARRGASGKDFCTWEDILAGVAELQEKRKAESGELNNESRGQEAY